MTGRAGAVGGGTRPPTEAALVGRDPERERLQALLDASADGRGAALVVLAEPGAGGTALLEDLERSAGDCLVLSVRGVEAETTLAYAGLAQLLAPVLELRAGLPTPQCDALESALGLRAPSPGDRFATYAAALGVLAAAADRTPVLAAIDDAHWLDARRWRRCSSARGGSRPTDRARAVRARAPAGRPGGDRAPGAAALRARGRRDGAAARRGARPFRSRSRSAATLQAAPPRGNPLALVELPRPARRLPAARHPAAARSPPRRAGDAARLRVQDRATSKRHADRAAARRRGGIRRSRDPRRRALRLRGLGPPALESAEAAGLITLGRARVEFRHPLLRAVAQLELASGARQAAMPTRRWRRRFSRRRAAAHVARCTLRRPRWSRTSSPRPNSRPPRERRPSAPLRKLPAGCSRRRRS